MDIKADKPDLLVIMLAYKSGESLQAYWEQLHTLAELQDGDAALFFQELLRSPNWDSRCTAVELLGFHYLFEPESETIKQFQDMLKNDSEPTVRIAAAAALASQLCRLDAEKDENKMALPSGPLLDAFRTDPDPDVRHVAFIGLLDAAGVQHSVLMELERKYRNFGLGEAEKELFAAYDE